MSDYPSSVFVFNRKFLPLKRKKTKGEREKIKREIEREGEREVEGRKESIANFVT